MSNKKTATRAAPITVGEVLWNTFERAKERCTDVIAQDINKPERAKEVQVAIAELDAITTLQQKLFGTTRSEVTAVINSMKKKSVLQLVLDIGKLTADQPINKISIEEELGRR